MKSKTAHLVSALALVALSSTPEAQAQPQPQVGRNALGERQSNEPWQVLRLERERLLELYWCGDQ